MRSSGETCKNPVERKIGLTASVVPDTRWNESWLTASKEGKEGLGSGDEDGELEE
jgi:hypothetical protein